MFVVFVHPKVNYNRFFAISVAKVQKINELCKFNLHFSEDCGYFVPKVVGDSFRKLLVICSEDCGFLLSELPIIKIQLRYLIGVLSVYRAVSVPSACRVWQVGAKSDDY